MATQRTEHATRLSRFGFVNVHLVAEEDGLTLVDTAIGGSAKAILAAAAGLGAPIVRIVLTHAHVDHVGSLDALARELPEAEVLISTREQPLLAGDLTLQPGEPQQKPKGGFPAPETTPTRTFEPGERIGSLEVVAAPGHTPGHVALLDVRDRTLLCGDAYSTLAGVRTTAQVNPRFPLPGMATWHKPTALASARALRELEPRALAPGHGRIVSSPLEAMDRAIAKASRQR